MRSGEWTAVLNRGQCQTKKAVGGLWFALAVCDGNIWDATQEERVDVMSVELREPDPRDLRRVSGEQVCSLRTCEVLAVCGTFVGLDR